MSDGQDWTEGYSTQFVQIDLVEEFCKKFGVPVAAILEGALKGCLRHFDKDGETFVNLQDLATFAEAAAEARDRRGSEARSTLHKSPSLKENP